MNSEKKYIKKRLLVSKIQSILFYLFRICPVNSHKIVFCTIEGTQGYTCNPKYIAEEFLKSHGNYKLIWLTNDVSKKFPKGIIVKKNSLLNRAYHLSTAKLWIDNSRKQLEVRKRKCQIYIQTWHAKIGFKPTCLDRGKSFSRVAYLVSKHDSDMIDYVLSNSKWYDNSLATGMMYEGNVLRSGSPRCDILVNAAKDREIKALYKKELLNMMEEKYGNDSNLLENIDNIHFSMYAPTFRGGSQSKERTVEADSNNLNFGLLTDVLSKKFGGNWIILVRLHPQLSAKGLTYDTQKNNVFDISKIDDMYPILAGCDAFLTDYSSAAFDAALMKIPVILYTSDYEEYKDERGALLWNLEELPFLHANEEGQLYEVINHFDAKSYAEQLEELFQSVELIEDGKAAKRVYTFCKKLLDGK